MNSFDYIIVGAGTAGAVIASRLTEDENIKVLLVEAGPHFSSIEETPSDLLDSRAVSVDKHDWHYMTEVTPGRDFPYARGKVSGGCSAVNGVISLRGLQQDFRAWAAAGNPGWDWEDILPMYKRIESDLDFGYASFHGSAGKIPIQRFQPDQYTPVVSSFRDSATAKGYAWVPDHNHPNGYDGVGPIPMNRAGDGSLRVSSSIAYLLEAQSRSNLVIKDKTTVNKVLFSGKKAIGVEVLDSNNSVESIHGGEVILCAGTINSPSILLRSGVGPVDDLDRLDIKCVNNLQGVGSNLIDHSLAVVAAYPKPGIVNESDDDVQMVIHYTAPGSSYINDMQIYCLGKLGAERFPGADPTRGLMFGTGIVINRPQSRGRVSLQSSDPSTQPRIDHRLNSHAEDMRKMVDGVRRGYDLLTSGALNDISGEVAVLTEEMINDTRVVERYISDRSATIWHAIGTCKMGPSSDNHAVVDQYLNVHECSSLRVVDCSVFPDHVSRNPMLTCYAVAERLVDIIKAGH